MTLSFQRAFCRFLSLGLPLIASLTAIFAVATSSFAKDESLLANGDMEASEPGGTKLGGWTSFLWDGDGAIEQTAAAFLTGRHAAVIENVGPSKQAIFQRLNLAPCSYRLTGAVATYGLEPGLWQQTTSVLLIYADQSSKSNVLSKGDSDWRRLDFVFDVAKQQEIILYFFNFGSGRLFVDDVKLTALPGCKTEPGNFAFTKTFAKPLAFDPPPAPADYALAGYCKRADFADREVCRRLKRFKAPDAQQTAEKRAPLLIADFEGKTPFPAEIPLTRDKPISGATSAVLEPDKYISARHDLNLPEDWRGYDWVRFDIHNPTTSPQPFTVAIWDDKTNGYWSRVNWYTVAAPGTSTMEVPLQVFVGEKSVVQERRRLDLAHIRQLVFMETKVEMFLDNIRLEADAPLTSPFPELIALDLGTPTSPTMTGFTPFVSSAVYREGRGYGLIPRTNIARAEDRRHPDNLHRDWISFTGGGLQFDLPNGDYRISMVLEDPGYWEYFPSWRTRTIFIQDKDVLTERPTYNQFLDRYFRHANDEDLPGDDTWARYVKPRYEPLEFTGSVSDGRLTVRFTGGSDPFATALSSIVIYPVEREAEGRAFLAEIQERLKKQFDAEYRQVLPASSNAAPPPPNALNGELWLFNRSAAIDVNATDTPSPTELVNSLGLSLARGEYAPLTLALRAANTDLEIIDAALTVRGLEANAYRVRNKMTRLTYDGSIYMNKPRVLDPVDISPQSPLRLKTGQSIRLWFDIHAPPTATPGAVTGELTLKFAGGAKETLPVKINVRPWVLPPADIPIGYLGVAPLYPLATYPELSVRREQEMQQSVRLLQRFGMTAVAGGLGNITFTKYREAKPLLDFTAADKTMAAIGSQFAGPVATYSGLSIDGISVTTPQDTRELHKRPYEQVLKDVLDAISDHAAAHSWPPLVHIVGDEPAGDAIKGSIAVAQAFKQARPDSRTGVFTSFTDLKNPASELAGPVNLLYMNHHSETSLRHIKERGSDCSLYNRGTRYGRGVYLYKVRRLGCYGHMQFAFSSVHADPWYALDGREDDYVAVFTHLDGNLRLTLDFVRYREAVNDYRYLLALEQAIAAAPEGPVRRSAASVLAEIESAMEIGEDKPNAWTEDGLDAVREKIHQQLIALSIKSP